MKIRCRCLHCSKIFYAERSTALYCNDSCRVNQHQKRKRKLAKGKTMKHFIRVSFLTMEGEEKEYRTWSLTQAASWFFHYSRTENRDLSTILLTTQDKQKCYDWLNNYLRINHLMQIDDEFTFEHYQTILSAVQELTQFYHHETLSENSKPISRKGRG